MTLLFSVCDEQFWEYDKEKRELQTKFAKVQAQ